MADVKKLAEELVSLTVKQVQEYAYAFENEETSETKNNFNSDDDEDN